MFILSLILIVSFFIFLYNLYFVAKEDFVIVRRDISMEKIFNLAFLTMIFTLFFSRFFYVLLNPKDELLNILGFLAITYLPGLSLIGGILGGISFVFFYSRLKKLPSGKLVDLFTVSLLGVLPIGFLLYFIASFGKTNLAFNILFVINFIISIVFIKFVYKLSEKGEVRDGSFTLIFLAVFALFNFLINLFTDLKGFSFLHLENIILFVTLFASLILLVNQEIMEKFLEKK